MLDVKAYDSYFGGKSGSGTYQTIINHIPPHGNTATFCDASSGNSLPGHTAFFCDTGSHRNILRWLINPWPTSQNNAILQLIINPGLIPQLA